MDFDVVVIGAGVVGLAVARSLSKHVRKICVIEKNSTFGKETSSRNSEVIHSAIYYPINSLKSKLCLQGNKLLYKYCRKRNIRFENCGKLIIGSNVTDVNALKKLKENADTIGIKCTMLENNQIKKIEPLIMANYALKIDSTGVVDSHSFMASLENDLKRYEVDIAYKTCLEKIAKVEKGYNILITNPDSTSSNISTNILVNCAGLYSSQVSSLLGINNPSYQAQFWKGSYFWVNNKLIESINNLIYPVPNASLDGLGIHTTKSIDGRVRVGPDAEYLGENMDFNYFVDPLKKDLFFQSLKKYLPFLKIDDLEPDFSGIRPKLQKPGDKIKDFIIKNEKDCGFENFINIVGIESPGLTSSLAIGEYTNSIINWDNI